MSDTTQETAARFIPVTAVRPGHRLVGGIVVSSRISKSGKSIWFTMRSEATGVTQEWPRQSTATQTCVFNYAEDAVIEAGDVIEVEITGLQGAMAAAAQAASPLPARFTATPVPGSPSVVIGDSRTGRMVEVGLCDYHGARKTLAALFPGE